MTRDKLDKETVLYIADMVRIMVANDEAGEIEETLRRLAPSLQAARPEAPPTMNEERAREILGTDIQPDGGLYNGGQYVAWTPGKNDACLDANFTADELEAIAFWMRRRGPPNNRE